MHLLRIKSSQKPKSQTAKILEQLKKAGRYGLFNYELSKSCLSWHRRVGDLRKSGENIVVVRIKGGVYKYYWVAPELTMIASER